MRPGLWLQKLTDRQPDATRSEVAITSLRAVRTGRATRRKSTRGAGRLGPTASAPAVKNRTGTQPLTGGQLPQVGRRQWLLVALVSSSDDFVVVRATSPWSEPVIRPGIDEVGSNNVCAGPLFIAGRDVGLCNDLARGDRRQRRAGARGRRANCEVTRACATRG